MSSLFKITEVGSKDAFYRDQAKVVGTVVSAQPEQILESLHEGSWLGFFNAKIELPSSNKFDNIEYVHFHQVKVEPLPFGIESMAVLSTFEAEGKLASFHFADDTGKEYSLGFAAEERAMQLVKEHPELLTEFRRIGKSFLWSFSDACKRFGIE